MKRTYLVICVNHFVFEEVCGFVCFCLVVSLICGLGDDIGKLLVKACPNVVVFLDQLMSIWALYELENIAVRQVLESRLECVDNSDIVVLNLPLALVCCLDL